MNRREVRGFNIAVDDRIVKVNDNQWRVKGDAGKIYTVFSSTLNGGVSASIIIGTITMNASTSRPLDSRK